MFKVLKALGNNFLTRIFSVILAIILWFWTVSNYTSTTEISLPLQVVNIPSNAALAAPLPPKIAVTLEGLTIDLLRLRMRSFHEAKVEIDARKLSMGTTRITSEQMQLKIANAPNVKMSNSHLLTPINVKLATRVKRKVPLKSRVVVNSAPGYAFVTEPYLNPDSITISGAREVVFGIDSILTIPEELSGVKFGSAFQVNLDTASYPHIVDILDTIFFMNMQIEPLIVKTFQNVNVQLIGDYDRSKYRLDTSVASIEIEGCESILKKINVQNIGLYIEYNRFLIENETELEPIIHMPFQVKSWRLQPAKFSLIEKQ